MSTSLLLWKSQSGRSQMIFLALLASLYLPMLVNSLFISLFVLHSFFTKGYFGNIRMTARVPLVFMAGFFAVGVFSLLYTEDVSNGLVKLQTKLSFLLMPFAIAGSGIHRVPGFKKKVLNTFLWATIFAALAALLNAAFTSLEAGSFYKIANDEGTIVKQYYFTYTHLAFFIMHPGYFSLYVSSAIFISIYLFLTKNSWVKSRWFQLLLLAFLFIFLLLLQGRISLVSFLALLFLGVLIYFFHEGSYWKGAIAIVLPIASIVAVLALAPHAFTRRFTEFNTFHYKIDASSVYDFNGLTLRLAEWHCALDAIEEQPLLGYGIGDAIDVLFESYRRNDFVVGLSRNYNAHNQYLETLLQTGILGLFMLLMVFAWFLYRSFRTSDLLLFMLISLFILSMITESMLERHSAIIFFCSLLLYLAFSSKLEHKILTRKAS